MPFDWDNATTAGVDAASFAHQAEIDSLDGLIMTAAAMGTGVVTGCAVSAQGGISMSLDVAAGIVIVAGDAVDVSAGSVTIGTADLTQPRFDLITVDAAGTKAVLAGAANAAPCFPIPTLDADGNLARAVLAAVYVPALAVDINTGNLADRRVFIGRDITPTARLAKLRFV
jgi:hypothetical protein